LFRQTTHKYSTSPLPFWDKNQPSHDALLRACKSSASAKSFLACLSGRVRSPLVVYEVLAYVETGTGRVGGEAVGR
jgi:hypothetical protein